MWGALSGSPSGRPVRLSLEDMDQSAEIREFLSSRRAKITPERVGLPAGPGPRRVPGLRRSEVAQLAGISVEYYTRLERGALASASPAVLDGLASALQLDDAERAHLLDLARAAERTRSPLSRDPGRGGVGPAPVRPALQQMVDAITGAVAFVRDEAQNMLAVNALGRAFYVPAIGSDGVLPNLARFQFLDPASRALYPEWETMARMCVGILRADAGRNPHHRGIQELVGELSTRSDLFRTLWAAHDVRVHGNGLKRFDHPEVGRLELAYEELAVTADPGQVLYVYSAPAGSEADQKLRLLASLAATDAAADAAQQAAERRGAAKHQGTGRVAGNQTNGNQTIENQRKA